MHIYVVYERDTHKAQHLGRDLCRRYRYFKKHSTQRIFWKLAIVEELLPGKDGSVRAARVEVASADRNLTIFSVLSDYPDLF